MSAADTLAHAITALDRRLRGVERTARLPHSSIDAGTLTVTDDDGATALVVGRQEDGSYQITGVGTGQVVANAVGQDALDQIAVELALADGMVQAAMIAVGAVTTTAIADDAITTPKIVAGAIQAGQIAAGAVAAGKIAAGAVTAGTIAANAVTAGTIAANAVTASAIAADAIDGYTITGAHIRTAGSTAGERVEIGPAILEGDSPAVRWTRTDGSGDHTQGTVVGSYDAANTRDELYIFGPNGTARSSIKLTNTDVQIFADRASPLPGDSYLFTALDFTAGGVSQRRTASRAHSIATSAPVTSTTYVPSSAVNGVDFVAPPSGSVMVHWNAEQVHSSTSFCLASFEVRTGSTLGGGSVYQAASDDRTIRNEGASVVRRAGATELVTGLSPGVTYHVRQMHRTLANTYTVTRQSIQVISA